MKAGAAFAAVLILLLPLSPAAAESVTFLQEAPEQFHSDTPEDVVRPGLAVSPTGDVAIVWQELARPDSDALWSGYIRFFLSDGAPRPPGEQLNLYVPVANAFYSDAAVGIDGIGVTTAVWMQLTRSNPTRTQIFYRRFDRDGSPLGTPTSINDDDAALGVQIAVAEDGRAIIVWAHSKITNAEGGTLRAARVFAQRISADGTVSGTPIEVATLGEQANTPQPRVAIDAKGDGVIAWAAADDVNSRRVGAQGTLSNIAIINQTPATTFGGAPAVAVDREGQATFVWNSDSSSRIVRRRYDAAGAPLEGEIEVYAGIADSPSVAVTADGDAVVAWAAGSSSSLRARYFNADGRARTADVIVAESSSQVVELPQVAVDADGDATFAWQYTLLTGSDGERTGHFRQATAPVPSGGGGAWSLLSSLLLLAAIGLRRQSRPEPAA